MMRLFGVNRRKKITTILRTKKEKNVRGTNDRGSEKPRQNRLIITGMQRRGGTIQGRLEMQD